MGKHHTIQMQAIMETLEDEESMIPESFLCPITVGVMEYPFTTSTGNTFEYSAISQWLNCRDTDPVSGVKLPDKRLVPNHLVRSQILAWFECNPNLKHWRNIHAPCPPTTAYTAQQELEVEEECGHTAPTGAKMLRYISTTTKTTTKSHGVKPSPLLSFRAFDRTYRFTHLKSKEGKNLKKKGPLMIECDGGVCVEAPGKSVFATSEGLIFYDAEVIRETRVLLGTDQVNACKFQAACNNSSCKFAHPFVCMHGTACERRTKCKFLHPEDDSADPVSDTKKVTCKYRTSCSNKQCIFAHPKGRMTIPRTMARVMITHSLGLERLDRPIQVGLDIPVQATRFHFQGEFVFFLVPHAGPWASGHYKSVIMHRYDAAAGRYEHVTEFALDMYYCKCVAGLGRSVVISWCPYDEKEVRAVWEAVRTSRETSKEPKDTNKQIEKPVVESKVVVERKVVESKDEIISRLNQALAERDAQISEYRNEIALLWEMVRDKSGELVGEHFKKVMAKGFTKPDRSTAHRGEATDDTVVEPHVSDREEPSHNQIDLEQQRQEEPAQKPNDKCAMHVYAQQRGTAGLRAEDYKLVLDYHKVGSKVVLGALDEEREVQRLEVVENEKVHCFEMMMAMDDATKFPITPAALCPRF
eukprot:c15229_g1_i1.p1 GENE.c15229_g1_i1~~c15229_g1_i1.p1  ORF type:complete len:640 (-),score=142.02 c15229_g1_i1:104-2023(-)